MSSDFLCLQARGLLDAAERHAEWVKAKRNVVDFAPKDQVRGEEPIGNHNLPCSLVSKDGTFWCT